jgi:hypothetical protein
MKNNTVRIHRNGGKKARSSQAQTGHYEVIQRAISYNQVSDFIDVFQRLEFSRDEVLGLLALGLSTMRLLAKDDAGLRVMDCYAVLVSEAEQKMRIAVNTIHSTVFNFEPRVDDPWKTSKEIEAEN